MTDFLPTDDGASAVLRAGRRRRTAKLTGASSSALAVVLGVALVLTGGTGSRQDELVPADDTPHPTATVTVTPSSTPVVSATRRSAGPREDPADPVLGTGSPGATAPPPAQHRSSAKRVSPITRVRHAMDRTDLCDGDPNVAAYGYCLRTFDPGVIHRGHRVAIGGELCVPATGRTTTIHAETTREVDIRLSDSSGVLWQAGEGLRYTSPGPTITVEPGSCVGWTSPWDTRDREGFVVPPGSYDLTLGLGTDSGVSTWGGTVTVED